MRSRRFGKKATVIAVVLGVMLVAGIAFAAWTATGSGSGSAKAGSSTPVVVEGAAPTSSLYPDGPAADVAVKVTNNNPFPVTVTALNMDPSFGTNGYQASDAGCNTSSLTYTNQTVSQAIPANSSHTFDLSGAISMDNTAVNACQGNTFQIGLTAVAASS